MTDLKKLDETIKELELNSKEFQVLNNHYQDFYKKIMKSHDIFLKSVDSIDNYSKKIESINENIKKETKKHQEKLEETSNLNKDFYDSIEKKIVKYNNEIDKKFSTIEDALNNLISGTTKRHNQTIGLLKNEEYGLEGIGEKFKINLIILFFGFFLLVVCIIIIMFNLGIFGFIFNQNAPLF